MPQKTESTFIVNSLCFLYKEQGQDLGYHGWLFFALYIYGLLQRDDDFPSPDLEKMSISGITNKLMDIQAKMIT